MKTMKILKLFGFMIFLSIIAASCQKTDLMDESVQTPTDNTSVDTKDYCGNTLTFPLNYWDEPNDYGSITIANDESNLIFNYDIDESNGYYIRNTYIFIINDGDPVPLTIADVWNPDGSAHTYPDNFPFITPDLYPDLYIERQEIISFAQLENEGIDLNECLDIVAIANLWNPTTNSWKRVFAKTTLKSWGWYVDFCIEECTTFSGCETGYAYGGDQGDCFLNIPNVQGNNWGWSNGGITEGTYNWPIYAGAGQCNISNGTHVGTLNVVYEDGIATITYILFSGISLEETHLHVGDTEGTRLPVKKGKFKTAPGQYLYSGGSSFTIEDLTGEIWITAHAVVCGED